jgi:hypothetical protein
MARTRCIYCGANIRGAYKGVCPECPENAIELYFSKEDNKLLEDRKQRVLETTAKMLVDELQWCSPEMRLEKILMILQDNFHSYDIRNKA